MNKEGLPRKINNERYWNGYRCVDALDYGQTCFNESTDNECKYKTQETSCIGPAPYKCQCLTMKYFNKENKKCEILLEMNETCSQTDSCKNGNCIGKPPTCKCQMFQFFDQISGQCLNQFNITASLSSSLTSKLNFIE